MASQIPQLENASDAALVDLLRVESPRDIAALTSALGVTATAVRQRLNRLIEGGIVEKRKAAERSGSGDGTGASRSRGRPAHAYGLTEKGRHLGGDNFRDLALVLWKEIRDVRDPEVRRGLFNRVGVRLAELYREAVHGRSAGERLESVAGLMRDRQIPCSVGVASGGTGRGDSGPADRDSTRRHSGDPRGLPVLTSHACPYPELAEQDRGICAAERLMLEELVGAPVKLSECRLDGEDCCRFTVHAVGGVATPAVSASNSASNPL